MRPVVYGREQADDEEDEEDYRHFEDGLERAVVDFVRMPPEHFHKQRSDTAEDWTRGPSLRKSTKTLGYIYSSEDVQAQYLLATLKGFGTLDPMCLTQG